LPELEVRCYPVLGSSQDAEDVVQETFMGAWRGIAGFEGRASVRTWLYRIATNRCLDALRSVRRRPAPDIVAATGAASELASPGNVIWLEPYPDVLVEELVDQAPGPEARYEAREAISLAFVSALQVLPPHQRVVLVLRDVLGFRSREVAVMLESSEESVSSALKRARATLHTADFCPAQIRLLRRARQSSGSSLIASRGPTRSETWTQWWRCFPTMSS
jgi:RNA polymerase sigma-70 factor (TIGR02960 family)